MDYHLSSSYEVMQLSHLSSPVPLKLISYRVLAGNEFWSGYG